MIVRLAAAFRLVDGRIIKLPGIVRLAPAVIKFAMLLFPSFVYLSVVMVK